MSQRKQLALRCALHAHTRSKCNTTGYTERHAAMHRKVWTGINPENQRPPLQWYVLLISFKKKKKDDQFQGSFSSWIDPFIHCVRTFFFTVLTSYTKNKCEMIHFLQQENEDCYDEKRHSERTLESWSAHETNWIVCPIFSQMYLFDPIGWRVVPLGWEFGIINKGLKKQKKKAPELLRKRKPRWAEVRL